MTRIVVFLLSFLVLLASCSPSCADDAKECCNGSEGVGVSQLIICRVLEFSFCDVRPEFKKRMMIGPFRLYGGVDECTCAYLLPPFCSSANAFFSFNADGFADTAVAVYSDKIGFFREYSPCWRLRVVTTTDTDIDDFVLEVNYSYRYGNDGNDGFVTAMQRLPLRAMSASACRLGGALPEARLYTYCGDESVPFSIVCLCFTLHGRDFILCSI